jgi:hypothetical protein
MAREIESLWIILWVVVFIDSNVRAFFKAEESIFVFIMYKVVVGSSFY